CPSCGEALVRLEGESDTFCVNVDCPGQRVQRISHFASRGAMDIEHLGERTVSQFGQAGLLGDVADIYSLDLDRVREFEGEGAGGKGGGAGTAASAHEFSPLDRNRAGTEGPRAAGVNFEGPGGPALPQ